MPRCFKLQDSCFEFLDLFTEHEQIGDDGEAERKAQGNAEEDEDVEGGVEVHPSSPTFTKDPKPLI